MLVVLGVRSITVNFPLVPMNDSSKYNSKWQKADFYSNLTFCLSLVMLYMYEYMYVYGPVTMPTATARSPCRRLKPRPLLDVIAVLPARFDVLHYPAASSLTLRRRSDVIVMRMTVTRRIDVMLTGITLLI